MGAKTREKFHSCLYNFKTSPLFTLLPELTLGNAVSHYQLPYHRTHRTFWFYICSVCKIQ